MSRSISRGWVDFQIDDLIKSGKLLADSRADIMSSASVVAVKRGAPKPDIGTVEAFKQEALKATSVTYLKEGASTIHLRKLFAQLGISEAISRRLSRRTAKGFPSWSPKAK